MKGGPLVTAVVPTYNRRDYLPASLDAILAQDYVNMEVVVADDGSTDGTAELIPAKYGDRITYLRLPHSGLPAVARDAGVEAAQGAYIAFCDSDDVWMPGKLSEQMRRIAENRCNFSCSDALIAGQQSLNVLRAYRFRSADRRLDLLRENFVVTSSVVVERDLLLRKRVTAPLKFPAYQDYVLWLGLVEDLRIDFIPKMLVTYRRGAGISAAAREHDARLQLKILFTQPAFRRHPVIAAAKALRYAKALLARAS